jgi:hypothetical protein
MIILSSNAPAITEALKRLAARVGPAGLRPAMKEIGEELRNSTRARFQLGAAPDGTPWLRLAADTLLNRLRRGRHGDRPLIDTGQLSRTIRCPVKYRAREQQPPWLDRGEECPLPGSRAGAYLRARRRATAPITPRPASNIA